MHIHHLPIPLRPTHNRRDQYQSIAGDEIPNTSLVPLAVASVGLEVELEGGGEGGEEGEEEEDGEEAE